MKTEFNFNSHICTTREQSERLLLLGLKKETADMVHSTIVVLDNLVDLISGHPWTARQEVTDNWYPAWSLGRLIKLMPRTAIMHTQEGDTRIDIDMYAIEILVNDDPIAEAVSVIEWLIKEGNFPKEYLEE